MRRGLLGCALGLGVMAIMGADEAKPAEGNARFIKVRDSYVEKYRPLWLEAQSAWWEANLTGKDEVFARKIELDQAIAALHADADVFRELAELREKNAVTDPMLRRELEVMYRAFLAGQADPEVQKRIIALQNKVEQTFNTHRSNAQGRQLSENDVRAILRTTADSSAAMEAWLAYHEVGKKVAEQVREVARLRNEQARQLGFANFFEFQLAQQELPLDQFWKIFDGLEALTAAPFAELKDRIDAQRAKHFNIAHEQLRPWHFGDLFFQEAPPGEEADLDALFADADLVELTRRYYESMGMPIDDILARSDLYEKPGKSPHAFCNDKDRAGDIRELGNLKANAYWADTMLHEIGHAVYDKYIDKDVPFLLHTAAHSLTTEGMAQMFGAMIKNPHWLRHVRGLDESAMSKLAPALRDSLRTEKLIFARWTQVMVRFEQGMYENPEQDLAALWWKLKQRYQLIPPPDDVSLPGYAAKVHILTSPVYYHSYMLGDLFAAQVHAYAAQKVLGIDDPLRTSFYNEPKAGAYFKEKIFGPGNLYSWNELTKRATGAELSADAFARYVIGAAPK
jgi:peptidyl-dipeptidase A